ncbi:hypothetical protein L9F63_013435, partial [Diploptera punctata]
PSWLYKCIFFSLFLVLYDLIKHLQKACWSNKCVCCFLYVHERLGRNLPSIVGKRKRIIAKLTSRFA